MFWFHAFCCHILECHFSRQAQYLVKLQRLSKVPGCRHSSLSHQGGQESWSHESLAHGDYNTLSCHYLPITLLRSPNATLCHSFLKKKMDVAQNPHQIQPRQTKDFPTSVIETRKLKDDENGFMTFGKAWD